MNNHTMPDFFETGTFKASCAPSTLGLNNRHPTNPAIIMANTCPMTDGTMSTKHVVITIIVMRVLSGQRLLVIPQIACATMATAAIFKPCKIPVVPNSS